MKILSRKRKKDESTPQRADLRRRHLEGLAELERADPASPAFAEPDTAALPPGPGLPEFGAGELTPGLLRAAILRDGCALVRGLVPRDDALEFADEIDRAFEERERSIDGQQYDLEYYDPFHPEPPQELDLASQAWVREGGGLFAPDSPVVAARMFELLDEAGVTALIDGYLGQRPLISSQKTTLRKSAPDVSGAWHQDGRFLGGVRAMNLWLALSRCGDEAPGLDIVPKRFDEMVPSGTDDAPLWYCVSDAVIAEVSADAPVIRPIFEPGDAMFFDDLFLHKTGSDPSMPNSRFALECWHFGATGFPGDYAPIAA